MKYHKLNKNSNNITQRARYNHPHLRKTQRTVVSSSYWLVVLVLLAHTLLFSLRPFQEKRKRKTSAHCHVSLETSVGRSFPTRPPPSLLNKLPVIVGGISSHNSARPSDSVTRAARCFHFFEIPLTNLLYDSVTKKPPALNGLFVQKATPGVKKKTAHNKDVDEEMGQTV